MDSAMERKLKKLYGKHYNLTKFYEIVKILSCSLPCSYLPKQKIMPSAAIGRDTENVILSPTGF